MERNSVLSAVTQRMNKVWRVAATGLCFSIFGIGALCLTFVVFPLLTWSVKDPGQRELRVQSIIQRSFALFCRTMRFWGAIDYEFVGASSLLQDRNCLIVANHPSLIDYVLIGSCLPQCDCLVKAAIWHNPFMKGIVKAAGYIPNRDPESLLDACSQRLDNGNVLLIFPEGTRTTLGIESKLQRGAAQIAVRTQTDLRMVHITVEPSFLTKQAKWYQVPDTKPFFRVEVKEKIAIEQFLRDADSPTTAARQLNRHLADVIFPAQEKCENSI
ncbi:1-acyl-sn-glycerol-3-phosphate acyltransferase [Photobacterium sp. SDRW27]|uniref:lysophospholipid acyltransferase family protein n=1 Tax=Photobacterium obscurum TaxID=2829490 RepID=UPI002244341A|nr:lysophospholipid acyltransferase family protein [Photobacterium obscurum]MCW8328981.1 1-acyl-sn-glycerol-3-phosphate acyltransferase [Photobacterium obscurum]